MSLFCIAPKMTYFMARLTGIKLNSRLKHWLLFKGFKQKLLLNQQFIGLGELKGMELLHWFLVSNIVWLIILRTMIVIKASWIELLFVAFLINVLGSAAAPITYYVAICLNLLFFLVFLLGGISEKLKSKNT